MSSEEDRRSFRSVSEITVHRAYRTYNRSNYLSSPTVTADYNLSEAEITDLTVLPIHRSSNSGSNTNSNNNSSSRNSLRRNITSNRQRQQLIDYDEISITQEIK